MILNDVHQGINKRKNRKRIGRGPGSGHGKTSGRGHKGAGSRSGYASREGFAGGSMPLFRLVAKRGFNNRAFADKVFAVNVSLLERKFDDGEEVTLEILKERGIAPAKMQVLKILGNGELSKKLNISAHRFSQSAEKKISDAGGKASRVEAGQ